MCSSTLFPCSSLPSWNLCTVVAAGLLDGQLPAHQHHCTATRLLNAARMRFRPQTDASMPALTCQSKSPLLPRLPPLSLMLKPTFQACLTTQTPTTRWTSCRASQSGTSTPALICTTDFLTPNSRSSCALSRGATVSWQQGGLSCTRASYAGGGTTRWRCCGRSTGRECRKEQPGRVLEQRWSGGFGMHRRAPKRGLLGAILLKAWVGGVVASSPLWRLRCFDLLHNPSTCTR